MFSRQKELDRVENAAIDQDKQALVDVRNDLEDKLREARKTEALLSEEGYRLIAGILNGFLRKAEIEGRRCTDDKQRTAIATQNVIHMLFTALGSSISLRKYASEELAQLDDMSRNVSDRMVRPIQ